MFPKINLKARNKPADGSATLAQKNRDKTPAGQKGCAPTKATAHTVKQQPNSKQGSIKGGTDKPKLNNPPTPKATAAKAQQKKKKKHQQHDLLVTIDLVRL